MAAAKKGVGKGDIVTIDYEAFLADNDRLFDTTIAESAKNAGFYDEKYEYGPMPLLLGAGKFYDALEDAIEGATVGKETEVKLAFADAAGARDPKLVETYQIKEFHRQDIDPRPGAEVQLGNRRGTVMYVGAGRVKVDFNNPLAGKDLRYRFTVRELIEDPVEKAKAVVKMTLGTSDGFEFTITDEKVSVILPELTKFDQTWPVARFAVVADLRKVANVDTVEFTEVWSLKEKKKDDAEKPAKKKAAKPADDASADGTEEKPAKKKAAPKKKADAPAADDEKPAKKKAAPKKKADQDA